MKRNRITRQRLVTVALAATAALLCAGVVQAASLTVGTTAHVSENHSVFDVSVYPGTAGYDGVESGDFGDGTIVDYRFFNNSGTTFNGAGYANGGAGVVSTATATNSSGLNGGALNWADVWTTNDPGSQAANFTTDTVARSQGVSGTIDISGLDAGSLYFMYGSFSNPNTVSLTMTGSGQPNLTASHTEDPPSTNRAWATSFGFEDASLYDTISYTYTNTDTDASRARFMGVVVDDTPPPPPPPPPPPAFNVQAINTNGPNPGNNTANWLNVWNALDAGAGPTGTVAGYSVQNNASDTEVVFDYAGGGGNYGVNNAIGTIAGDGPGGGPGPFNPGGSGGSNYSIRAQGFLKFNEAGTYSIAMGSDDGRRIELTAGLASGYTGFTARGDQVNGAFTPGDTVVGFSGGTGHNQSVGVFDVAAGDILVLDAFYYEGGGGDSGEISIARGSHTSWNSSDFELLGDGALNGAITAAPEMEVPEPATMGLLSLAACGLGGYVRRRRKA